MFSNHIEIDYPELAWTNNLDVDEVNSEIIKELDQLSKFANELFIDIQSNIQESSDYYSEKNYYKSVPQIKLNERDPKYFDESILMIPRKIIENLTSETQFYSKIVYKLDHLKELKEKTLFEKTLLKMNDLIIEKGFIANTIELLIEKGYSGPDQGYFWHYDNIKTAIVTCYSNKTNWSTRILHPSEYSYPNKPSIHSQLAGFAAKIGYFYDANKLCHRAPQEDLLENPVQRHEFRVVIGFVQKNKLSTE